MWSTACKQFKRVSAVLCKTAQAAKENRMCYCMNPVCKPCLRCIAGHKRGFGARAQMVALLYYTLSYFPGGTMGVRFVLQLFSGACMQCFSGVRAAAFR